MTLDVVHMEENIERQLLIWLTLWHLVSPNKERVASYTFIGMPSTWRWSSPETMMQDEILNKKDPGDVRKISKWKSGTFLSMVYTHGLVIL